MESHYVEVKLGPPDKGVKDMGQVSQFPPEVVGVLAGATADHLLVDLQLHQTLCYKHIRGRTVCEVYAKSPVDHDHILSVWERSFRQCKLCNKGLTKWREEQGNG